MGVCTLEYEWLYYIVPSLVSFFSGLAIIIPVRIIWSAFRTKRKTLLSSHHKTQSRFTKIRLSAEAILSGNTKASKTVVIVFWLLDIAAFGIYVAEASLFELDDRDVCGSIHEPLQYVWIVLMFARLIRFIVVFIGAQDKLVMWLDIDNVVDHFLIVPTIVGIIYDHNWLGLRVLVVVHLMKTPMILQMVHLVKNRNEMHIAKTIVVVLTVWLLGAGISLVLENNGDPFPLDNPYQNQNQFTFGESLYFIFITLTTIGYGDMYPHTVLGRGFIVIYVLLSLALFTSLIPELGRALSSRNKYRKPYKKSYGKCHLVICGNPTFETLSTIVKNFIHEDAAVTRTDLVVIQIEKPSTEVQAFFRRHFNDVTFIHGTVLHIPTLKLAKVESAEVVFILANRAAEDKNAEDSANIMRATAVKNLASDVRIVIQLLQHHNKEQLLNIPSWKWNGVQNGEDRGDEVICMSELKMAFMAQNCLAPGIVTMLSNLICMRSFDDSRSSGDWMDDYRYGAGHELYVESFSRDFIGMTFTEAALLCYNDFGILLLAVEHEHGRLGKTKLLINPGENFILKDNDVGFFIAQGPTEVKRVADYKQQKFEKGDMSASSERELLSLVALEERKTLISQASTQSDEFLEFLGDSENNVNNKLKTYDGVSVDDKNKNGVNVSSPEMFDPTGTKHWCLPRTLEDATLDEDTIREYDFYDHIVFVLQADGDSNSSRQTVGLVHFVGPLRSSSLSQSELKPIVFYAECSAIQSEWKSIANFPQVYVYERTHSMHSDLRRLNVHRSSMCLVVTTNEMEKIDDALVDKNTILTTMNILSLRKIEEKLNQLGVLANPEVFRKQFAISNDFPMLVQLEYDESVAYIDDDDEDDPSIPLYQTTPYAGGRVLLSSVLDSMVSTAFLSSKINRLIRTLTSGGDASNDFERLMFDGVGIVRRGTMIDVSKARRGSSLSLLSLTHGPLEKFQKCESYGQLLTDALRLRGILCLGLYRLLDVTSKDPKYQKRFVITSPPHDFKLILSDKIYVLKPLDVGSTNF